ncbi:ABC transporter substrate-binding protein [Dictyobacter aurantiacus]|uniref:Sugar ABC transporter substrate-binding protein n=1 Tax=Dictyobacter aurantiacus TaxID=1936993 RepID=A0A401ZQT3_9CHLR|nr:ABC transporter substrate-binding protein [Dictyobacter aurantiacus]GCE09237.1 sugar ABC transporter substrate-binding protein [Dictyobacter aurantiacus]
MRQRTFLHHGIPLVLALFLFSTFLIACGGDNTSGNASSSGCSSPPKLAKKSHYRVGFSQQVNNAPWRIAETTSVQEEASRRGDTVIYTDAQNSDSKQVSDIQSIIAQHPDVLLIAPLTEDGEVSAIKQAAAACIPVILLDRDANHSKVTPGKDYITFIGSDFVREGQRVAQHLIQKTNGKAKIIELQGTTGSSPAINRTKGFEDEIQSHSGMQIIARQDANFDRATGLKTMQTLLQSHPEVTAVYAENDEMALGAIDALKAAGKKPGKDVLVASIDGENAALQAVQNGEETIVVQCNPRLGPIAFDTIDKYANGTVPQQWVVQQDNQYTADNITDALSKGAGF